MLKNDDNVSALGCSYFAGKGGRLFFSYCIGDSGVCACLGSFIDSECSDCDVCFGVSGFESFTPLNRFDGLGD